MSEGLRGAELWQNKVLTTEDLTKHEKEINPWLTHSRDVLNELSKNLLQIEEIVDRMKLHQFGVTFREYVSKMDKVISSNLENILKNFEAYQLNKLQKEDLVPVMELLQRVGQGNDSI